MEDNRTIRLNNGVELPLIGFGTYLEEQRDPVILKNAIEAGYRYFDTASAYGTEEILGQTIANSGIPREQFFLASKVWRSEMGYNETLQAFENSLKRLGTDYLDLYLIHWPRRNTYDTEWKERLKDTWSAMETLYSDGKVKAIGVCNCLPHHLEAFIHEARIIPAVNQLELHVGYMQPEAVRYCREHNITLQAWSPLARRKLQEEALITETAERYGVSIQKLLLAFLVNQGISVLPRTSRSERMKSNREIYDLKITEDDISYLSCLPQMGWSGEHPDYPCQWWG